MSLQAAKTAETALLKEVVEHPERPVVLRRDKAGVVDVKFGDRLYTDDDTIAWLPGIGPEDLASSSIASSHGVRLPYVVGEMANGIASVEMVHSAARNGMLGFFGAAGLSPQRIEQAAVELSERCANLPWGSNLIHSFADPEVEEETVNVYLRRGVTRVSASAFLKVLPSVVRYAVTGLRTAPDGAIVRRNHLFPKVSRPDIARQFLSPAPEPILNALVAKGSITAEEARLARRVPLAEDLTVEGDSGGHTDNRPLLVLFPAVAGVAEELRLKHGWSSMARIGAAGGLGTPAAVAAAFSLGAAYVLTGSINQCARESAQGEMAKRMLAQADPTEVMMAPCGDMFEMGVKVQVLKRGGFFPLRAARLFELYRAYGSIDEIPSDVIAVIERDIFRQSIASIWAATRSYFLTRKPEEVARAEKNPKHRMALVFRWYLGHSSRWSLQGDAGRQIDYQIWCGPAMGAFNQWVAGSFLEDLSNRTVGQIGLNLMQGAASVTRAQQLRAFGAAVPPMLFDYRPRPIGINASADGAAA